jgi:putative glycosyltransferase (TIGR04348 family)
MSEPFIEIVTPAAPGSLHGNRQTANRWSDWLTSLGYACQITQTWSGDPVDCLIALHANRSHASICKFKAHYPDTPIILMLTGTDIYRDFPIYPEVLQSMQMADAIVVLQAQALQLIPQSLQEKTRVIYQSVKSIARQREPHPSFIISLIGHLRPEKDPFLLSQAIKTLPPESKIYVQHFGKAMQAEMSTQALWLNQHQARYHWYGEMPHQATMQALASSDVMVITSLMEGGAHVVSEAIAMGVPVIASHIPGNVGLLGENYSGYFPVGDAQALTELLLKAESNPQFYQQLEYEIAKQSDLVQPETEKQSIADLLREVMA